MDTPRPISEAPAKKAAPTGCIRLFLLPFFIIGLLATYKMLVEPAYNMIRARRWEAVPCRITGGLGRKGDPGSPSRREAKFEYQYEFGGHSYTGSRARFVQKPKQKGAVAHELREFPVGMVTQCFVNPDKPEESVLERHFTPHYFWGLFCLPFLAVGVLAVVPYSSKNKRLDRLNPRHGSMSPEPGQGPVPRPIPFPEAQAGRELQPQQSVPALFFGLLMFSLIWNGVVLAMAWPALHDRSGPPWFFILIFGGVGLLVLGITIYQGLRMLFTPRIRLVVRPMPVVLGDTIHVEWEFPKGARGTRSLQISLEGLEVATYRRGTSTTTDRKPFLKAPFVELHDAMSLASGDAQVQIPADLIHSFKSANNSIEWVLHVTGDVPMRPDIDDSFVIEVLPYRVRG